MTSFDSFARSTAALAVIALATGCASVAPGSEVPAAMARHGANAQAARPAASGAGVMPGVPARAWWQDLADPSLDTLVGLSLQHNHELKAALAAVEEARALAGAASRDAYPRGGLEAKAEAVRPSSAEADPYRQAGPRPPSRNLFSLGQTLAWEVDLFGRVGTATAVAERQADAAQADAHAAAALLQGEVVRHYVELRHHQQALVSIDAEAGLLERRALQMNVRVAAGLADRREALAAAGEQARLVAQRAQVQAAAEAGAVVLAVLAGRSPTARDAAWDALLAPAELPAAPRSASIVQPADLLTRRPDVARADARLRASLGNVVLAERAHLPRLSLNFFAGLHAPFGALGDAGALRYAAGPVLQWDWLDAGRRTAREAAARAGSEAAWHGFEQAVLTALQESETSLRRWSAAQVRLQQARADEALARQAAAHASARASAGLEPVPAALKQAAAFQQSRREALAAQAGLLQAHVQVQLALGAWQPAADGRVAKGPAP